MFNVFFKYSYNSQIILSFIININSRPCIILGEYIFDEYASLNEGDIFNDQLLKNDSKFLENNMFNENDTILSEDSYLPFDSEVCDDFCDLSEVFSPNQLSHILTEDISTDSDYLSQIENLGKELEGFEDLDVANGINSTVRIFRYIFLADNY